MRVSETLGHGKKVIGASRLYQKYIIDIRTRTNVYCIDFINLMQLLLYVVVVYLG